MRFDDIGTPVAPGFGVGLPPNPSQPQIVEANGQSLSEHARTFDYGLVLAESNQWKPWVADIGDEYRRSVTAIMLETTKRWVQNMSLDETTKVFNVGNFDKFAFPLVRAIFPNLIANDIVSVQPMAGPVSLIFYLDFLFGTSKGQVTAGTSAFDAITGPNAQKWFSHDIVDREVVGTGNGSTTAFSGTLAFTPVRKASVVVEHTTNGSTIISDGIDNAAGTIAGTNISSGSITYTTGAWAVTFSTAPANGSAIWFTYEYNSEASDLIPQVDLQLTSAPVTARSRKLRARWSLEAAQNLNALHSIDAEAELIGVLAEEIKFELDREIIDDLWAIAPGDTTPTAGLGIENQNTIVFSRTVPGGISWTEYKLQFIDHVVEASNKIYRRTRRGAANFMVMDVNTSNIVQTLPSFDADPGAADATGVIFQGTLNKQWRCYKDPYLNTFVVRNKNTITGMLGVFLLGYKGASFLDAGYVYAPYIPLYSTPTVVLDDFIGRKGMATQYGKRKVNENFYVRGYVKT